MKLRVGVGLCAAIIGASGLTLCQPPTPRIASVTGLSFPAIDSVEAKGFVAGSSRTERVGQVRHPDGSPRTS